MMRFPTILGVAGLVLSTANGCATITRGSEEALEVKTQPPGADVQLSTGETCTTPCAIKKKRNASFTVNIRKEGFKPVSVNVNHQTAGGGAAGMAGNLIFGGVIGAGVDAASGATQELVPNPIEIDLETAGGVAEGRNGAPESASAKAPKNQQEVVNQEEMAE